MHMSFNSINLLIECDIYIDRIRPITIQSLITYNI